MLRCLVLLIFSRIFVPNLKLKKMKKYLVLVLMLSSVVNHMKKDLIQQCQKLKNY